MWKCWWFTPSKVYCLTDYITIQPPHLLYLSIYLFDNKLEHHSWEENKSNCTISRYSIEFGVISTYFVMKFMVQEFDIVHIPNDDMVSGIYWNA